MKFEEYHYLVALSPWKDRPHHLWLWTFDQEFNEDLEYMMFYNSIVYKKLYKVVG